MAKGFFSPKLTLNVGDGFEFMKKNQDAFDVIITDSSDPVGKHRKTQFLALLLYLAFGPLQSVNALFKGLVLTAVCFCFQAQQKACSKNPTTSS